MTRATLHAGFLESAERLPNATALRVGPTEITYATLLETTTSLASVIARVNGSGRTVIIASGSATAYEGILGALLAGTTYVPIGPDFPAARAGDMFDRAGADTLIVGPEGVDLVIDMLADRSDPVSVVAPWLDDTADLAARLPHHRVLGSSDVVGAAAGWTPPSVEPDDAAYLLFTSGSTGAPKGVEVTHANVTAFLDAAQSRYAVAGGDRLTQFFELVFDLSVFDMFMSWDNGATLCVPADTTTLKLVDWAREVGITHWFSVPSLGIALRRMRRLTPDSLPDLRFALFCGEALPVEIAESFATAAPGAHVENLYGPTEATIACTVHRWSPDEPRTPNGIVPIGVPLAGTDTLIVDEDLQLVGTGEVGELLLGGVQVTPGYLGDEAKTAERFVQVHDGRWYRTGDLAVLDDTGVLLYRGRTDHQIQISGERVELGEIEAVVRAVSGRDAVVAMGWPETDAGYGGTVAFIAGDPLDEQSLLAALKDELPARIAPRRIEVLDDIPLNVNGKFDRPRLRALLMETG